MRRRAGRRGDGRWREGRRRVRRDIVFQQWGEQVVYSLSGRAESKALVVRGGRLDGRSTAKWMGGARE